MRAEFSAKINQVGPYGEPVGIEKWRQIAASVGYKLAIPEWGTGASLGNGAVYIQQFSNWLRTHAGDINYEIYFNVGSFNNGEYQLFPSTKQQQTATAYVQQF